MLHPPMACAFRNATIRENPEQIGRAQMGRPVLGENVVMTQIRVQAVTSKRNSRAVFAHK